MDFLSLVRTAVKAHYEKYVYPQFPLLSSIRTCDAYALNLDSLWAHFYGEWLPQKNRRILLAGSGGFSPYPAAVANPDVRITALDLSRANLRRARLHTRLHGYRNVDFLEGDLLKAGNILRDRFHLIDCYGVLHHIPDAVAALQALHFVLQDGGLIRIMVYSRCARRPAQSIRTAIRILGIQETGQIRKLYRKAKPGSRFRDYLDSTSEARSDSGLADMFLHPYVKTYVIDELLEILDAADFAPLLFTHYGALADTGEEVARLRRMERSQELSTNFILFAGRKADAARRLHWEHLRRMPETFIMLNPVICKALPLLPFISIQPEPRLGFDNPLIDFRSALLLSKFRRPLRKSSLNAQQRQQIQPYLRALFLVETARAAKTG